MTRSEIDRLNEDLMPNDDIFSIDDEDMYHYKKVLQSLPVEDRTIMLMYIHYGSLRKVAEQLGVSHTLVYKNIIRIRKEFTK